MMHMVLNIVDPAHAPTPTGLCVMKTPAAETNWPRRFELPPLSDSSFTPGFPL
jgi:hypothetical protein